MKHDKNLKQKKMPVAATVVLFCMFSCKPTSSVSEASGYRTGVSQGSSCYSDANYHRRLKQELAILADEFIASCFVAPKAAGLDVAAASASASASASAVPESQFEYAVPYFGDDGMWAQTPEALQSDLSDAAEFEPFSIFHFSGPFDKNIFDNYKESAKRDQVKRTDPDSLQVLNSSLVPDKFTAGGQLSNLNIFERLDNGKSMAIGLDWRDSLKDVFNEKCKGQLLAMKDRATQILETYKAFTAKKCCVEKQGVDFSKGLLACKNMDDKQLYAAYPSKIVEWSTCGGAAEAVCGPQSTFPASTKEHPATCSRCELRLTGDKWYHPKKSLSGIDYDLKVAKESRITCRSAASGRSAISTWCINQHSPLCKGLNLETSPVSDIFKRTTPYMYCATVPEDSVPIGPAAPDSKSTRLDYITVNSAGGEFGVGAAAKLSVDAFIGKVEAKVEGSLAHAGNISKTSQIQILSKGSQPIYQLRQGRIEFSPMTELYCGHSEATQSCTNRRIGGSVRAEASTLAVPGAPVLSGSVDASVVGNTSRCVMSGVQTNTDLYAKLPPVGGLTLAQAISMCASQEERGADDSIGITEGFKVAARTLGAKLSGSGNFADWLPSIEHGPGAAREIFSLDISRRNLYCQESATGRVDDGSKLSKLALNIDAEEHLSLDVTVERNIRPGSKSGPSPHVRLDASDQSILDRLIDPSISNSTLLAIVTEVIAKDGSGSPSLAYFKQIASGGCAYVDRPTHFDLSEQTLTCSAPPETEKWKIGHIFAAIEGGKFRITAFDSRMQSVLVTRTDLAHLGTWPQLMRQGVLTANDAIRILEIGFALQNKVGLSCLPDN